MQFAGPVLQATGPQQPPKHARGGWRPSVATAPASRRSWCGEAPSPSGERVGWRGCPAVKALRSPDRPIAGARPVGGRLPATLTACSVPAGRQLARRCPLASAHVRWRHLPRPPSGTSSRPSSSSPRRSQWTTQPRSIQLEGAQPASDAASVLCHQFLMGRLGRRGGAPLFCGPPPPPAPLDHPGRLAVTNALRRTDSHRSAGSRHGDRKVPLSWSVTSSPTRDQVRLQGIKDSRWGSVSPWRGTCTSCRRVLGATHVRIPSGHRELDLVHESPTQKNP
jgi:hypothetical protein